MNVAPNHRSLVRPEHDRSFVPTCSIPRRRTQERSMMAPVFLPGPPPKAARSVIDGSECDGILAAVGRHYEKDSCSP
jgi:hypothetical protein